MKSFTAFLFALICAVTGAAQSTPTKPASADLIEATEKSKTAAEQEVPTAEKAVTKATTSLSLIQQLASEGLVAQVEVERAEEEMKGAKARVEELNKQIANSISWWLISRRLNRRLRRKLQKLNNSPNRR